MKVEVAWSDRVPERDSIKPCVYDMCYRPDGAQLVVAVGNRVLIYDANDGDLVHSLKGHKDTVYCVAYSRDGKRFASGGADKTIIIWTSKCEGILKYSHNESIQALAYNPVTQQLASATSIDFGLWSPEQKTVTKEKVSAKVLSASWTNDGQYLALGQFNGHISIRDRQGQEKVRIERSAPIWSLQWSPVRPDGVDVLAVGCWDKTLSFYQLSGAQLGKDRELKYDPCSLSYFGDGEYLLIGGSDRKVNLMTKEGVFLSTVAEREDWVWSVKARPKHKFLAVGCNDGTIATYQTLFSTVHGLFQDRYAYRDTMTDVIIQHLSTEQKVRIKTRDFVKKIAIYRDRLAVQLPDRVLIYETNGGASGDENDMHYRLKEKIVKKMDCNLLVVTSQHIILCQEKKLQLHSFKGRKVREWTLEAVIRYIKVIGGPPGREGLLVGLKNGQVLKIFVDNRFPVLLIRHRAAIRCLDLSASKRRMAVVDENSKVFIYDLLTKEITFEESNATSVAWNSELEEMFCFSGNGQLSIKTGDFPIHRQKLQGFVVGFKASKIFCLHFISMQTIDVPQSASMHRYLERNDYESALRVACLGVTESDWRDLANEALQGLALPIARKAFIRVRDMRFIELLNRIELTRRQQGSGGKPVDDSAFLADILAYQGHYDEASRLYLRSGQRRKAVEMYLDLRDWEKAKEIVESAPAGDTGDDAQFFNLPELLKRQAQWLLEVNDARAAQEMFWAAKDYSTAIQIIGEHQWLDVLIEKCRSLNKSERKALSQAAAIFRDAGNHQYAKEVYLKLDDAKALMKLHVELQKWDEAFALVSQNPDLQENIYAPYAEWLAINDRFDEAQDAFRRAGRPDQSLRMLERLTHNAVTEHRYGDAGYYYWLLATETLKFVTATSPRDVTNADRVHLRRFSELERKAELYYAYNIIYRYTVEPFVTSTPETIFNTAQFILNAINTPGSNEEAPHGISRVYTLIALAKQAKTLGAFKLARKVYERLATLRVPPAWRDQVDAAALTIRSKRFSDRDELLPICARCSTPNPLLGSGTVTADSCVHCGAAFVRSLHTFDALPLVEFSISDATRFDDAQIRALIEDLPPIKQGNAAGAQRRGERHYGADVQTLEIDGDMPDDDMEQGNSQNDAFHQQLLNGEASMGGRLPPICVDSECVRAMPRPEVFVRKSMCPALPARYFRNVIPEVPISMCPSCCHFFHEEDFEFAVLQKKACPFCRTVVDI